MSAKQLPGIRSLHTPHDRLQTPPGRPETRCTRGRGTINKGREIKLRGEGALTRAYEPQLLRAAPLAALGQPPPEDQSELGSGSSGQDALCQCTIRTSVGVGDAVGRLGIRRLDDERAAVIVSS